MHCTAACFLAFCCRNNAVFERTFMPRPDVVCMHAAAGSCKKCHAAGCVNKTRARELKSSARFKTKAARQSMQEGPCNQAQSIPVASGFLVGLTPKHAGYSHGDRGARASTVMRFRAKLCTVFTRRGLTAPHNHGAPHTPARCSREVACSSWLGAWVAHLSTGATSCVCSRQHDTRHHEAVVMTSKPLDHLNGPEVDVPDGNFKTLQSHALVAEDSLGRLRQRGSVLGAALFKVKLLNTACLDRVAAGRP